MHSPREDDNPGRPFFRLHHKHDICRRSSFGSSLWQLGRKGRLLREGRDLRTPSRFSLSKNNGGTTLNGCGSTPSVHPDVLPQQSSNRNRIRIFTPGHQHGRGRGSGLQAESPEHIPNLISRRQFNVRRKLTACLAEDIRRDIAKSIDGGENVFVIDSKPVKVCQLARAKRCVMGNDNPQSAPSKGFCASQQMYYYGYKLHAICGISGVIHSYDITAANVHDIHYLDDAKWDYHDCLMLGDKGYLSAEVQQDLFETAHIKLEVPYRLNQKNWRNPSWAYRRFRKRIETVFSQLNDQFMMVRNYAKQTGGLFTRTAAKIAAMTVLQYINFCNHRKIGLVKDALF